MIRIHRFIAFLAPLRPEEVGDKLPEGVKESSPHT